MTFDLTTFARFINDEAKRKGFYDGNFNLSEKLMLIVSELGEAQEADRKDRRANLKYFLERQKVLVLESQIRCFESSIKDTVEDELADAIIRILDLCGYLGIDINKHIELKVWYNSIRPHKHGKKY